MPLKPGRRTLLLAAVLLFASVSYFPLRDLATAFRLLNAVRNVAAGASGSGLPITEKKLRGRFGDRELEAIAYFPSGTRPSRGIIMVPGVSELGCYHPRLVALARFLADAGTFVLTPDIVAFREFRITAEPVEELLFWYRRIRTVEGGGNLRRVGLGGVSFSGSLSLIAAARPEIRDSVAFVMGIGCYNDLKRLTGEWFRPGPPNGEADRYPTHFYAKWIMMLAARDLLPDARDQESLKAVLISLLTEKPLPANPDISPQGLRWYNLATGRGRIEAELEREIEQRMSPSLLQELDPRPAAARIRCPVFLVHGGFDDLIPADESRQLMRQIRTAPASLLVSPFITHTHPFDRQLGWGRKAAAGLAACAFMYNLARVLG